jgi:hypothetical protein
VYSPSLPREIILVSFPTSTAALNGLATYLLTFALPASTISFSLL